MTSLYHLRSASPINTYRITKLDADYNVEATYLVSKHECTCPAGTRDTCRHRQMLPFFLAKAHIDNGWMLDWHTRQWRKPLCEDRAEQPIDDPRAQEEQAFMESVVLPSPSRSPDMTVTEIAKEGLRSQEDWARAKRTYASQIEEPVPPIGPSLEAEVERARGPAPAPSASPPLGMKRRKIL